MDLPKSTKVVYNRIQKLDPENVSKILRYILIQEHADRDMIRLAFSPDNMLHSLINKIKTRLGLTSTAPVSAPISPPQLIPNQPLDIPLQFMHFSQSPSRPFSSPGSLRATHPYTVEFAQPPYADSAANCNYHLQNQLQFLSLEDQLDNSVGSDFSSTSSNFYCQEPALGPRTNRRSPSLPEFPLKVCHYYIKGFCKHGNNCRYFHPTPESFSQMLNNSSPSVFHNEDSIFPPGTLEKLELEITELLKSRRGFPVSIASLPMLYYEKYGKSLQADGYLTESQRHGKAGYSLTKLLARLKNNIRLIDRPHGQHSVILAEDYLKYMDFNGERSDQGVIVASSRQIYLTFPAESTFMEQDVSNYFNKYGPVQDVRIPCQQKRMFGFVTFVFAETVKHILTKGNPHFVCGARVLVKPYREKSRLIDRKYVDKMQHSMFNGSHFDDQEPELHSMPQVCDNSALIRQKLLEEHQALELDRKHLPDMQLVPKAKNHHQYFGYSIDEFKLPEACAEQTARAERTEFTSADHLSYMLDVLNNGSTADDKVRLINTRYDDQESCGSQGLNLPDSPFAAPIGSGISTVT